jgi:hypothetical protein
MADKYLAYFDTDGFECVFNLTALEGECVMATLAGEQWQLPFNLEAMKMRARFNGHRQPEIWFFNVDSELSENTVRQLAEENPQYLADFIRANGKNIYGRSNSADRKRVID